MALVVNGFPDLSPSATAPGFLLKLHHHPGWLCRKKELIEAIQQGLRLFQLGGEPSPGLGEVLDSLLGWPGGSFFCETQAIECVLPPFPTPFSVAEAGFDSKDAFSRQDGNTTLSDTGNPARNAP